MIADLMALRADVEQLKTLFGNAMKSGPVEVVDPVKGYRLKLGEGEDGPFLSPWYPHPESGKSSVPLKRGQVVGVVNPTGDPRQGFIVRGGYSDEHSSPNGDMAANVFRDAGVELSIADGTVSVVADKKVTFRIGGLTFEISPEGIEFEGGNLKLQGGRITHDGRNIGSDHVHGGVESGGDETSHPE